MSNAYAGGDHSMTMLLQTKEPGVSGIRSLQSRLSTLVIAVLGLELDMHRRNRSLLGFQRIDQMLQTPRHWWDFVPGYLT